MTLTVSDKAVHNDVTVDRCIYPRQPITMTILLDRDDVLVWPNGTKSEGPDALTFTLQYGL